jgi:microcin C transport system substrate-binding protein
MLPYIENLRKIGIKAVFRNLEVNIFKNRLDNFDFDMAIISYPVSQLPGNEQREYWGSAAADMNGSNNIIGIKNPVVDELIKGVIGAEEKADYVAYVKALDRVLTYENYMIFQWYSPFSRVGYADKFSQPQTDLKIGFQPYLWWVKEK